ncbi:conserved Plasmodium protein, unknown function [Plasmodium knowlesi strain H]|uniref:Uncharacterized protein n=3 Tax=Plasmodium knowlesi TaxID=5850 RepID=A0A5K1UWS1_PLAKH|nr:conserved Plasmodium protein, unknown function [Plasmodium knowlesi strain H]OTN66709.1 Uncharacterized protein PKNOH_S08503100 [Plasmodium knowlesi]CAA9986700.1 conserved Plasmodium protein, unknown function [Plasmodium knowlesi strain H]SBO23514.1 conserved Plasmodium protein, unknown function [Plasmodium knowlesi strain H]SBO25009.1 conserved Plasmodium protein, unknown function [Plasmodium knowlesi strain H]VVS76174.1 conserved Plasmodium protein, unknown function [Plasmodium knowlesi s|eukprot:XP_002257885.1 hypothetical protein, conserved in Plasmodium species [Plasmodium knowlesi strain H]
MASLNNIYSKCREHIARKFTISNKRKIYIINNSLFLSFILFYISYFFFINGIINPAVKIVFHGNIIADTTQVYENSILESIWLLFTSKSYFNMGMLLFFSIIIPILKFIMVSDNFYCFFKLYNLSLQHEEEEKEEEEDDIFFINTVNENEQFILKKFSILSSISRFQFVDVLISLFIVSSLNLYLLEAKILSGAYHFLNYCLLSTISSFFLLTLTSLKIRIFKRSNIKIYALPTERCLSVRNSLQEDARDNRMLDCVKGEGVEFHGKLKNGKNDSPVVEVNKIDLKRGGGKNLDEGEEDDDDNNNNNNNYNNNNNNGGNNPEQLDSILRKGVEWMGLAKKNRKGGKKKVFHEEGSMQGDYTSGTTGIITHRGVYHLDPSIPRVNQRGIHSREIHFSGAMQRGSGSWKGETELITYDHEDLNNSVNERGRHSKKKVNLESTQLQPHERYEKQLLCYNKLQTLNNINYQYKVMKNNDAYIYLKKKKFNSLLKMNFHQCRLNKIKIWYACFLFLFLCLCVYLITAVECSMVGIYIYLSYFNFNVEGILIDFIDMLNILKLKINRSYIYPFFVMLPFIFPVIIGISFFLSVLFMNLYYVNFSRGYKKMCAMNDELVFSPEVEENQKMMVSERYNYLYIKKEIEKNDRLSNTSDDLTSPNNSTVSSSKSEDINTSFIFSRMLNFYFSLSVFFTSICSFCMHISLGEIISISLLTFYQIVKHTHNLNILVLYKSSTVKFCKFFLFVVYGLLCLSINLYVSQWELYVKKLKKTKKRIALFQNNRYSEIVDLNIQKHEHWHVPIYSYFFQFLLKKEHFFSPSIKHNQITKEHTDTVQTMMMYRVYENDTSLGYQNTRVDNDEMVEFNLVSERDSQMSAEEGQAQPAETIAPTIAGNTEMPTGVPREVGTDAPEEVPTGERSVDQDECFVNSGTTHTGRNAPNDGLGDGEKQRSSSAEVEKQEEGDSPRGGAVVVASESSTPSGKGENGNEEGVITSGGENQVEETESGDISKKGISFKNDPKGYLKNFMPIKSILLFHLEKRRKKKSKGGGDGGGKGFGAFIERLLRKVLGVGSSEKISRMYILLHGFLFLLIFITTFMVFFKREDVFRFDMNAVNRRLNSFFKSAHFHSLIPNSIGKCKTKKYLAKEPCYNIGHIYHEEKTFYHATLLFLQGISSIKIANIHFYYEKGKYNLILDGYFKHIIGPLFLKLCIGTNFCPISTYAFLIGSKPTFSITMSAHCNDKTPPNYISDIVVKDLKITKIEVIKHNDIIENVDIQLDDIQERVQEKVNSMLAERKRFILWKRHKYNLEGFINYLISKNALAGFSCKPMNYQDL